MSLATDFDQWWIAFPRKVGKLAAQREYIKARKTASAAQLLEGIAHYVHAKPGYADYCYPKTFLSQGRWLDQADAPAMTYHEWICPHTPHCPHRAACAIVSARPQKGATP